LSGPLYLNGNSYAFFTTSKKILYNFSRFRTGLKWKYSIIYRIWVVLRPSYGVVPIQWVHDTGLYSIVLSIRYAAHKVTIVFIKTTGAKKTATDMWFLKKTILDPCTVERERITYTFHRNTNLVRTDHNL